MNATDLYWDDVHCYTAIDYIDGDSVAIPVDDRYN